MECPTCGDDYVDLSTHLNESYPSHLPKEWEVCHDCGKWFKKYGTHWSMSDCSHPEVSEEEHSILTGVLMGDGWVDKDKNNCRISVSVVEEEYLNYLDSKFGNLSCGVYEDKSGETNAKIKGGDPDNYRDTYRLQTICHPDLNTYGKWYKEDGKAWPENIVLNPITLKHWYVCDGHYKNTGGDDYITISMSNEIKNTEKIESYFERSGLPSPTWQKGTSVLKGVEFPRCVARWTVSESEELFSYMGDPIPGFEYKW